MCRRVTGWWGRMAGRPSRARHRPWVETHRQSPKCVQTRRSAPSSGSAFQRAWPGSGGFQPAGGRRGADRPGAGRPSPVRHPPGVGRSATARRRPSTAQSSDGQAAQRGPQIGQPTLDYARCRLRRPALPPRVLHRRAQRQPHPAGGLPVASRWRRPPGNTCHVLPGRMSPRHYAKRCAAPRSPPAAPPAPPASRTAAGWPPRPPAISGRPSPCATARAPNRQAEPYRPDGLLWPPALPRSLGCLYWEMVRRMKQTSRKDR